MKLFSFFVAIFIVLVLSGCGSTRVVATAPQLITPPEHLLEDCYQTPFLDLKTNTEILISFQTLYLDFKECNLSKKALRDWYNEMRTPEVGVK